MGKVSKRSTTERVFDTLLGLVQTGTTAAVAGAVTYYADDQIVDDLKDLPDLPSKDDITENANYASSVAGILLGVMALAYLLKVSIKNRAWRLSAKDLIALSLLFLTGVGMIGYSCFRVGVEEDSLAAGVSAAVGIGLLGLSANWIELRTRDHQCDDVDESTQLTDNDEEVVDKRVSLFRNT